MGQLQDAFSDAAGEVANIKAQPSNRYWWLYGTIKAKNGNGTLDVEIDGVTIQQVKATVSCMMANAGDRVIVLKAGPLMTCVDVIATSAEVKVPASSITGMLTESTLPAASDTSKGIMQAGSGLTVSDGIVSVDNGAYVNNGSVAASLFWSSGGAVADLDAANLGVCHYNVSTAHRPNDYGCCLTMRSGNGEAGNNWLFQLALPTSGDPKWRRNINGTGWSAWWTWATA